MKKKESVNSQVKDSIKLFENFEIKPFFTIKFKKKQGRGQKHVEMYAKAK